MHIDHSGKACADIELAQKEIILVICSLYIICLMASTNEICIIDTMGKIQNAISTNYNNVFILA